MLGLARVRKAVISYLIEPAVRLLARTPITPNAITWFGFVLAIGAAVLIAGGYLIVAGLVLLVAGFFDTLDGALARYTNRVTRFGTVLDATLDRLSEGALLLGVMAFFVGKEETIGVLFAGGALLASLAVSYVRAKAEASGFECRVGFFTREGRVLMLAMGLLLTLLIDKALIISLAHIIGLSSFTVVQRLVHVWRQSKKG